MRTADFSYALPASAIAQAAIEPRHAARLLDANTLVDHDFVDLPRLLDPGDVIVVNNTRVRAARLRGHKVDTGGVVEVLLLGREADGSWRALCRPARRVRAGMRVDFGRIRGEVVESPRSGVARLLLSTSEGSVEDILPLVGSVPLPPYFRGTLDDPDRYQTMFAKAVGSAAAPTAGLHFTPLVVSALLDRGIEVADIELEVGLDTFRPISEASIEQHEIHRERYDVPTPTARRIAVARNEGKRVVAVGTTALRTLETAAVEGGFVASGRGETALFIRPGYRFEVVDALLTNFHAPETSLVVLIAAILGTRWRRVYDAAIERGYRFLSFGDAMFVDRVRTL